MSTNQGKSSSEAYVETMALFLDQATVELSRNLVCKGCCRVLDPGCRLHSNVSLVWRKIGRRQSKESADGRAKCPFFHQPGVMSSGSA